MGGVNLRFLIFTNFVLLPLVNLTFGAGTTTTTTQTNTNDAAVMTGLSATAGAMNQLAGSMQASNLGAMGSMIGGCAQVEAVLGKPCAIGNDLGIDPSEYDDYDKLCEEPNLDKLLKQFETYQRVKQCELDKENAKKAGYKCVMDQLAALEQQLGQASAPANAIITQGKTQIGAIKAQIENDEELFKNANELLTGSADGPGVTDLIKDLDAVERRLKQEELKIHKGFTDLQDLSTAIQRSKKVFLWEQVKTCMTKTTQTAWTCGADASGSNTPVSFTEYLSCRYKQNLGLTKAGSTAVDARTEAMTKAAEAKLKSQLASLFSSFPNETLDAANEAYSTASSQASDPAAESSQFTNGIKKYASQKIPGDSPASFESQIMSSLSGFSESKFRAKGFENIAGIVDNQFKTCYAEAERVTKNAEAGLDDKGASGASNMIKTANDRQALAEKTNTDMVDDYQKTLEAKLSQVYGSLAKQSFKLPLDAQCLGKPQNVQEACVKTQGLMIQGMLRGKAPSPINITIKAKDPKANISLVCSNLRDCEATLKTDRSSIKQHRDTLEQAKNKLVEDTNNNVKGAVNSLKMALSSSSAYQSAMHMLGVLGVTLPTVERGKPDTDDDKIFESPVDLKMMLANEGLALPDNSGGDLQSSMKECDETIKDLLAELNSSGKVISKSKDAKKYCALKAIKTAADAYSDQRKDLMQVDCKWTAGQKSPCDNGGAQKLSEQINELSKKYGGSGLTGADFGVLRTGMQGVCSNIEGLKNNDEASTKTNGEPISCKGKVDVSLDSPMNTLESDLSRIGAGNGATHGK